VDQGGRRGDGEAGQGEGLAAIFDGPSLHARAWYAGQRSDELAHLSSAEAGACAALKILCSLLGEGGRLPAAPARLLFCWDGDARKTDKPRPAKPPEYDDDQAWFVQLLDYLVPGVAQVRVEREADDAVATAALREARVGRDVVVISGDKDLQQLQRPHVGYYCLNRRELLNARWICDHWKVHHPREVAVALAVIGDPGDGISGVPQLGPKRFATLRERFPANLALEDLVEEVAGQLEPRLCEAFLSSLQVTLLQSDIPDIPNPAPYHLASLAEFDQVEGLRSVRGDWARLLGRTQ
jgi:hypothetical protein